VLLLLPCGFAEIDLIVGQASKSVEQVLQGMGNVSTPSFIPNISHSEECKKQWEKMKTVKQVLHLF